MLFILRSRLLLYFAMSGVNRVQVVLSGFSVRLLVNRVQVVLSGFSVRLLCFVRAKTLCRYGCIYCLVALVLVCVDVMVISSAYAMTVTLRNASFKLTLYGCVVYVCCVVFASL